MILWLPCAVSEEKHKKYKVNNTLMKHSLCRPATSVLQPWILSSQGLVRPVTTLRELWGIPVIPSPTSRIRHLPFPKQAGPSVKQLFVGNREDFPPQGPLHAVCKSCADTHKLILSQHLNRSHLQHSLKFSEPHGTIVLDLVQLSEK